MKTAILKKSEYQPKIISANQSFALEQNLLENKVVSIHDNSEEKEEVKAFVTTDRNLLNQFYKLRGDVYAAENVWEKYNNEENEFDRQGKIIVAVDNGVVIGGARLLFSDARKYLCSETEGTEFIYKNVFKFLGIDIGDKTYSELSSFVVNANYRNHLVVKKIIENIIQESIDYGCHYIFGTTSLSRCRNYKIISSNSKFKLNMQIIKDFPWLEKGTHSNIKTFVTVTQISQHLKSNIQ